MSLVNFVVVGFFRYMEGCDDDDNRFPLRVLRHRITRRHFTQLIFETTEICPSHQSLTSATMSMT